MERTKKPFWFRYGLAVLAVALATLVTGVFFEWGGADTPRYISFYPAVIFVTLYGGLLPGLLAAALSSVAALYWADPSPGFSIESPVVLLGYLMFIFTNLLVVWICEKMHRATRRVVQAEDARAAAEALNAQMAATQQSEERYRAIFETAVDAIITIDERGTIESINPAGEKLFGYRAEELVGGNVNRLMPSPDREHHDQYLEHYLRTGEKKIIGIGREVEALRKDGTRFPIRLAVSETWLGARRIFTGQVHDITERKKMEQGLKEANEAALAANASKDQFLAMLSHELRTPLTPALMVIAARESDPALPADLREDLATARRNLELEAQLIDDLLDLNRVVRGKIQLQLQPQNLHVILQRALAVCRADFETKEQTTSVALQAAEHFIDADAGRLQQVFWNLLRNAAKFTPKGGSVTIRSSNPSPGTVRVEITDTGIGIAP
jgi:PAS domain S-box-containing protein